jgi:hypothetical protein
MSWCSAIARLKYAGLGLALITSICVLACHALYLGTADFNQEVAMREHELGERQNSRICAITLVTVSSIILILALILFILGFILRSSSAVQWVASILWWCICVLFLASLMTIAIACSLGHYDLITSDNPLRFDRYSYNSSKEIKDYVDGFNSFQENHDPPVHQRSLSRAGDDAWSVCGNLDPWSTERADVGYSDWDMPFFYAIEQPLPLQQERNFSYDESYFEVGSLL